jgi:hypothetical protein
LTIVDGITRIGGTMLMGIIAVVLGDRANRETLATGANAATSTDSADSADSTAPADIN